MGEEGAAERLPVSTLLHRRVGVEERERERERDGREEERERVRGDGGRRERERERWTGGREGESEGGWREEGERDGREEERERRKEQREGNLLVQYLTKYQYLYRQQPSTRHQYTSS